MIPISKFFEIPSAIQNSFGNNHLVFKATAGGSRKFVNAREYVGKSDCFCNYLFRLGIRKGNRIITMLHNSSEWHFVEMGIMKCGAIHVPLSFLYTDEHLKYILNIIQPQCFFVHSVAQVKKMQCFFNELKIECIVLQVNSTGEEGQFFFDNSFDSPSAHSNEINENDAAAILFTSGTTGFPKGVVLTHKNMLASVKEFSGVDIFNDSKCYVSFLPLCHSGERKVNYSCQVRGIQVAYPSALLSYYENIINNEADTTASVPYVMNQMRREFLSKSIYKMPLKKIVCGGAKISLETENYFYENDIAVYPVYGLTETASLLAYSTVKNRKPGTVGKIAENVHCKFGNDQEILVKGAPIMKGYWEEDFKIDTDRDSDGWFHTGDTGMVDSNGYLTITGRLKSRFKNSRGVYISPEVIEVELMQSLRFENIFVFGENQDFLSAFFVAGNSKNIEVGIEENVKKRIGEYNKNRTDGQRIEQFYIAANDLDSDFFSPSFKLRRDALADYCKKYNFKKV